MIGFGRPGAVAKGWPTLGAGPIERLRVLSVGDRFVPAALLGARLAAHGEPHGLAFDLHEVDLPYPSATAIPLPGDPPSGRIRAFWEDIDGITARLDADAADPVLREYTGPVDQLVPLVGDAQVLLVHAAPVSRAAVKAAGALRVVGTVRGGTVNINLDALNERGIPLFNTPGRNAQAVAEFVTGAIIAHLRGIVGAATALRAGRWSMAPWTVDGAGMELAGKTCGIVGFGQVARAFTPIARGIGMQLLATDPWVDPAEVAQAGVQPAGLDELRRGQPAPHRRTRPGPHAADGRARQHRPAAAGRHRGAPGRPARAQDRRRDRRRLRPGAPCRRRRAARPARDDAHPAHRRRVARHRHPRRRSARRHARAAPGGR
jgi:hypothetical protein